MCHSHSIKIYILVHDCLHNLESAMFRLRDSLACANTVTLWLLQRLNFSMIIYCFTVKSFETKISL